jgi:hypothetical protein
MVTGLKKPGALPGLVLEKLLWQPLVKRCYGRDAPDASPWHIVKTFFIWQKIFRLNSEVPWPVHPSSRVTNWRKIQRRGRCMPGASPGCYIQAGNGIILGRDVLIGPGVGIISANHSPWNLNAWEKARPITIGDHVWIGMNAVILPGVSIGDHAIVGAGSVVHADIPSHAIAAGNPCRVVRGRTALEWHGRRLMT